MDTDCDIVQWRNDNPIDYNKMAEAIINYPSGYQLEMYECIYNIIRRYIPQQLYKYYSLTEDDENEKSYFLQTVIDEFPHKSPEDQVLIEELLSQNVEYVEFS